jgi:hypothetical protein
MAQCLQQAESAPIGQAFIEAALSKARTTPSLLAFSSICAVASQVVTSRGDSNFFSVSGAFLSAIIVSFYYLDIYLTVNQKNPTLFMGF